jgi:peptidoglycan/xylan/chitin deacetylase (PgdA/CDA1 family)
MRLRNIVGLLFILPFLLLLSDQYFREGRGRAELTAFFEFQVNAFNDWVIGITRSEVTNAYPAQLVFDNGVGEWRLLATDGTASLPFTVRPSNTGFLTIVSTDPETRSDFDVRILGAGDYNATIDEVVYTQIPADPTIETFRVRQQEDMLPIFGYHYVIPDDIPIPERDILIRLSQSRFNTQVDFASRVLGCNWLTFGEVTEQYVIPGIKPPPNTCVITFDDGHSNNYRQLPVFRAYDIRASFYVITGRASTTNAYMTWEELHELARNGHEIGSHTVDADGFFSENMTLPEVEWQLNQSYRDLVARSFVTTTFAYPLGQQNEDIVDLVVGAGYLAGRDTEKDNEWRDMRTVTLPIDEDTLYHMHYIKPEPMSLPSLFNRFGYTGWWQFEERPIINAGQPEPRSSIRPSPQSYAVVQMEAIGDSLTNQFLVRHDGTYGLQMILSNRVSASRDNPLAFEVYVNDVFRPDVRLDRGSCLPFRARTFCSYSIYPLELTTGTNTLNVRMVGEGAEEVVLDRFSLYERVEQTGRFDLTITDRVNRIEALPLSLEQGRFLVDSMIIASLFGAFVAFLRLLGVGVRRPAK